MGDPLRRACGEPLPDHAAKREPAKRESLHAESVDKGERVLPKQLDGVVAFRRIGGAMTTQIVPQHTEVRLQICCLHLPLRVIAAQ